MEAYYNSEGRSVSAPTVNGQQMDMFCIFKAVASLGGYESVTLNRYRQMQQAIL